MRPGWPRSNGSAATHLDADGVAAAWAHVAGLVRRYEGMGEPCARQLGNYTVVDVPLSFEAGEMTARVSYDTHAKVAGLYILEPSDARSVTSSEEPAPINHPLARVKRSRHVADILRP